MAQRRRGQVFEAALLAVAQEKPETRFVEIPVDYRHQTINLHPPKRTEIRLQNQSRSNSNTQSGSAKRKPSRPTGPADASAAATEQLELNQLIRDLNFTLTRASGDYAARFGKHGVTEDEYIHHQVTEAIRIIKSAPPGCLRLEVVEYDWPSTSAPNLYIQQSQASGVTPKLPNLVDHSGRRTRAKRAAPVRRAIAPRGENIVGNNLAPNNVARNDFASSNVAANNFVQTNAVAFPNNNYLMPMNVTVIPGCDIPAPESSITVGPPSMTIGNFEVLPPPPYSGFQGSRTGYENWDPNQSILSFDTIDSVLRG